MELEDSDCLCDYLSHKKRLTELFFPNNKNPIISRHSTAYEEFWNFLQKLQKWIRSRSQTDGQSLRLLSQKRARLNLQTVNYRLEDFLRHREADRHSSGTLSRRNFQCFHLIFDMYLDFLQKQKISRIMKLRRDQAALPMAAFRSQLLDQLSAHRVVVVAGDTGCGKSTQVPQYLHFGELDSHGQPLGKGYQHIAVTQPRRIACISLAARVSTEMLNELGSKVAYQVRFERTRTKATQIVFITEGLLLRQMQLDPFLKEYDVLVLDEVHERHWQTDCLLGLVKCLVMARPELRVVLMSATINVQLFSSFFDNCPILEVPGRLFPIDIKYIPLTPAEISEAGDRLDPSPYLRLLQRIDAKYPATERGDLLVFVPGMADIQAIMEPARAYAEQTKRWIILPLHSTLSAEDQEKVFHVAPDGVRKCVLSTNISETSLTIDGIRFVADSGRVKELSWDASARLRRLKEFPISKASANQRKGRAGRTGPGVCFRFYSQEDYDQFEASFSRMLVSPTTINLMTTTRADPRWFPTEGLLCVAFNTPEIRRVPLETLVLQMMVMGLPDVKYFPFIEPPEEKCLDEAVERLLSHGALIKAASITDSKTRPSSTSSSLQVTPLGRLLADLPVEFSLGRMLIIASLLGLVEPVLSLVAGMSVQAPLAPLTSLGGSELARRVEALSEYESDHGDAFTVMNVFDEWLRIKSEANEPIGSRTHDHSDRGGSLNARRWCRRIGAQEQRLHEMVRLRSQFAQLLSDCGLWNREGSTVRKSLDLSHRRNLNRARRTERLKTKRRRLLTLQDGTEARSGSESEDECETDSSRLRKWLSAAGGAGSRLGSVAQDVSVRDLELVLCYDLSSLTEFANRHSEMTQADLQLLKVVVAGGLYPHLAIADDANAYRVANRGGAAGPGAEMVFHTRTKGFVTLHPNDVFVRNPDVLFPKTKCQLETEEPPKSTKALTYSSDHQLLMYLDLMETTRPFLVNTMHVPALPTLLLYCREVDTNEDATRIVFDSWIEVRLADAEAAQRALATAIWLRAMMDRLMELQLANSARIRELHAVKDSGEVAASTGQASGTECSNPTDRDPSVNDVQYQCRKLRSLLGQSLAAFLSSSAVGLYTLHRLLAGDVKRLFRYPPGGQPKDNAYLPRLMRKIFITKRKFKTLFSQ
ncbi:ATP dependent RNA helicase DHX34 [Fasciola hepatica]|uniref:ATP dependent RNA helicase DHX34 n=1 Tax=Fasciola hepatica TaxID=6192 RepID=A0A4E0RBN2_FASHE|nr:ATP dependent RNA helicase DHX34 [Fasciola hepatica]